MNSTKQTFSVPHDLNAEEAFVGGIIASEGSILDDLPPFATDVCYDHKTHAILTNLLAAHAARLPNDPIALIQRMDAAGLPGAPVDGGWGLEVLRLHGFGITSTVGYHLAILHEQVALRRLQSLYAWGTAQIRPRATPNELVAETTRRLALVEPAADADQHLLPGLVDSLLADLDDLDAGKGGNCLQTCIPAWNRAFGGLPEGAYLALGGRPGTGKTAMMEQIVFDLLVDGKSVCVFERDMSPKKLVRRIACRAADVPYWKLAKGYTSTQERARLRDSYDALNKSRLRLHNPVGLTAAKLCSIVRREIRLHGVTAVFLDHIQVLDLAGEELRTGLTRASTVLRANATETGVPHVVLFHINRNGAKGGRPAPEDVKEFDQLLGDVDGMAMLWSENRMEDMPKGQPLPVKFYTAKNRDGATVEDEILFDGEKMTFTEP